MRSRIRTHAAYVSGCGTAISRELHQRCDVAACAAPRFAETLNTSASSAGMNVRVTIIENSSSDVTFHGYTFGVGVKF